MRIESVDAYGEWTEEQVITLPVEALPEGTEAGQQLIAGNGQSVVVLEINDTEARLDANHPLAGEVLTFEIELVSFDN